MSLVRLRSDLDDFYYKTASHAKSLSTCQFQTGGPTVETKRGYRMTVASFLRANSRSEAVPVFGRLNESTSDQVFSRGRVSTAREAIVVENVTAVSWVR